MDSRLDFESERVSPGFFGEVDLGSKPGLLVGFVISKKLSCSSHSLRHQPLCSGGGGLHFLCWLGLVSPLMYSPTIPPHWSLTPSDLELGLRSHALRRGTSLPSGPGGWPI